MYTDDSEFIHFELLNFKIHFKINRKKKQSLLLFVLYIIFLPNLTYLYMDLGYFLRKYQI